MKILVASDKFKGCLTSTEANEAIREGLVAGFAAVGKDVEIRSLPVADGGDGLARTLADALGGEWRTATVHDALGERVVAGYGLVDGGRTAVIEMAEASGIARLAGRTLDPWRASTFGTGELLRTAARSGAERIVLGIGGSATNDAGTGMAVALGVRFLDENGKPVEDIPARLEEVKRIEGFPPADFPRVEVACDVDNSLTGPEGATKIYGPQKGIGDEEYWRHELRLESLLLVLGDDFLPFADSPGAGAAGGLGFGAKVFLGAELRPGFELVSELLGLENHVAWADLVITGEGKLDRQTASGKAPDGVRRLARAAGKPVHAFCGAMEDGAGAGFDSAIETRDPEATLEENLAAAAVRLREAAEHFARGLV